VPDNEIANSETELIRRAQAQDTDAFCALAARHARRIYLLALHYCQNAQDAEDLSQEVWLKAYQALGAFRSDSSFYTWLRRITINAFLNYRRTDSARTHEPIEELEMNSYAGPDDTVYSNALFKNVMDALADVTPSQRLMFLLRHYEGMSYEEIGTAMSCSRGTAKKSVWRTLNKLRAKFEVDDDTAKEKISCLAAEY